MINYTWKINSLWTKTVDGQQNYVIIADYGVEGVDEEFTFEICDIVELSTESTTSFIPYEELTEELVLTWVKEKLGENGIKSVEVCIAAQIESQKNPPIFPELTPLPWS